LILQHITSIPKSQPPCRRTKFSVFFSGRDDKSINGGLFDKSNFPCIVTDNVHLLTERRPKKEQQLCGTEGG
jgi:hypothetical protein